MTEFEFNEPVEEIKEPENAYTDDQGISYVLYEGTSPYPGTAWYKGLKNNTTVYIGGFNTLLRCRKGLGYVFEKNTTVPCMLQNIRDDDQVRIIQDFTDNPTMCEYDDDGDITYIGEFCGNVESGYLRNGMGSIVMKNGHILCHSKFFLGRDIREFDKFTALSTKRGIDEVEKACNNNDIPKVTKRQMLQSANDVMTNYKIPIDNPVVGQYYPIHLKSDMISLEDQRSLNELSNSSAECMEEMKFYTDPDDQEYKRRLEGKVLQIEQRTVDILKKTQKVESIEGPCNEYGIRLCHNDRLISINARPHEVPRSGALKVYAMTRLNSITVGDFCFNPLRDEYIDISRYLVMTAKSELMNNMIGGDPVDIEKYLEMNHQTDSALSLVLLNGLKTLSVGRGSFIGTRRLFTHHCRMLRSITFGNEQSKESNNYSFMHCTSFKLENLNELVEVCVYGHHAFHETKEFLLKGTPKLVRFSIQGDHCFNGNGAIQQSFTICNALSLTQFHFGFESMIAESINSYIKRSFPSCDQRQLEISNVLESMGVFLLSVFPHEAKHGVRHV